MENNKQKERQEDINNFEKWYKDNFPFIKELFNSESLVMSFEYIPSFLIAVIINDSIRENVLEFDESFTFYTYIKEYFTNVINSLIPLYNSYDKDISKLEKLSKEIFFYNVLFDIKSYLDLIKETGEKVNKKFDNIDELWFNLGKMLYNKKTVEESLFKDMEKLIDDIEKVYEDYESIQDMVFNVTNELGIPVHNIYLE